MQIASQVFKMLILSELIKCKNVDSAWALVFISRRKVPGSNTDDLVAHSAVQAFAFVVLWMTISQPYLEKGNDFCSPERAPTKAIFHMIAAEEKKKKRPSQR